MTIEEKKAYLKQYHGVVRRIRRLEDEVRELRLSVMPGGIDYSRDKIQTSAPDQMIAYIERLTSLTEMLERKRMQLLDIRLDIEQAINNMENSEEANVLYLRYIQYNYWEDIASELYISLPTVYRIHESALKNIKIKNAS